MKNLKEHGLFVLLFTLCAVLRFLPLFEYQFTFDELSGLDRTQFNSFPELIEKGVKVDAHPALVQVLIYYLTRLFGYVTWIIKLPFLLFSLGAVMYSYAFGLRNFSKQSGLFAALIFSFSLIFIFYAPIARMYISGIFFSLGLLYHFFEIIFRNKKRLVNYFFMGLFAWLSAMNQHLNALFAFTVMILGLFFLGKQNLKPYLITCLITVLGYLPHLPVTLYQFSIPGIGRDAGGWLEAPQLNVVFSFLKVLFGTGRVWIIFVLLILFSAVLRKSVSLSKQQWLLFALFVFNFLVIYVYSIYRSPIYQHSAILFSASALVLAVSSMIQFKRPVYFYSAFVLAFSFLFYKSYFDKNYLREAVKTVYEYQFERSKFYKDKFGEKEVYPLFFDCDTLMQKIYFKKYTTRFACKISSDSIISYSEKRFFDVPVSNDKFAGSQKVSSIRLFSEFISTLNCTYVTLSSSTPLYQAIVKEHFPYLIENTQTQAINFKVYSKNPADSNSKVAEDPALYFSSPDKPGKFVYSANLEKGIVSVDSLNEFPFEGKTDYSDVIIKEGEMVLVNSKVRTKQVPQDAVECVISAVDKETNETYSYNSKSVADYVMRQDSTVNLYSEAYIGTNFERIRIRSVLGVYVWNRGKSHFDIHSFEIKVIDYWPMKWHFWD